MPGFNRTGPMGAGPVTGRGRGMCDSVYAGNIPQSAENYGYGRGLRLGRGFRGGYNPDMGYGFGRRRGWNQPGYSGEYPENTTGELTTLKAQADSVKRTLETISRRIEELEKIA
jgi:hypothetical protein